MLAEAAGPDERTAKKMRPGHRTKNFHPGSSEVTFWGPIHHLPKATLPCRTTLACYKDVMSLSSYIQHLALVLKKSIKHQWGKVISAKEIKTKVDLQNLKRAKDISEFWLFLPRHLYNKTKFKGRCHDGSHI